MDLVFGEDRQQFEPVASMRRGECPTLQRPMQTGDGLLARLRVLENELRFIELADLARAARTFGNGLIEITARGSLQIRGLKQETVAPFEAAVLSAGIRPLQGTSVETASLAGLDPNELVDMRALAENLRSRIADEGLKLAPKLAITLDGGGLFDLRHMSADLKATAFSSDGGEMRFLLQAGGTLETARILAVVQQAGLLDAIMLACRALSTLGPAARGRDLPTDVLAPRYAFEQQVLAIGSVKAKPPVGLHTLAGESCVLGLAFPYGQAKTEQLLALSEAAISLGAKRVRLAPDHALLIVGLDGAKAATLADIASGLGFIADQHDQRRNISLCAGSAGCASAFYDTHALADRFIGTANNVLDGSFNVHLSGCSKGCAHPASSVLTLAGASSGYGLVVNGAASGTPDIYIGADDIAGALKQLSQLVQESRSADETVATCLTRLGSGRIVAALQLDRT